MLDKILPIKFENVSLAFSSNKIFKNLSLKISNKGISVIMGPNGAGKSLILKLMAGLIKPDSGKIVHANFPPKMNLPCGFVFQKPILLRRTVKENLKYPLGIIGLNKNEYDGVINNILPNNKWKLILNYPAKKLSVGEQQILSLLRAIIVKPKILFLDEPSSSLDPTSTAIIESLITKAAKNNVKIILATHNLVQAKRLAEEIMFFDEGRLMEQGRADKILADRKSLTTSHYLSEFI